MRCINCNKRLGYVDLRIGVCPKAVRGTRHQVDNDYDNQDRSNDHDQQDDADGDDLSDDVR